MKVEVQKDSEKEEKAKTFSGEVVSFEQGSEVILPALITLQGGLILPASFMKSSHLAYSIKESEAISAMKVQLYKGVALESGE